MEKPLEFSDGISAATRGLLNGLMKFYYQPMHDYLSENPHLISNFTGFLLSPEYISVYWGKTHVAVEYIGSETINKLPEAGAEDVKVTVLFDSDKFLEDIIGFESDSSAQIQLPLLPFNEDLIFPTNRGWDKMFDLGWNIVAQNHVACFNANFPTPPTGQFCRIINGRFFDANESGLIVRHIKWMDFFPITTREMGDGITIEFNVSGMLSLVEHDAKYTYPMPDDFKYVQLPKINRFIEVWGNEDNSETDITSFLARNENEFILTMKFGATRIAPEVVCDWQSEEREAIKPDFFVVYPNGFADIVEFKLPDIGGDVVVGRKNRETFGAWLNSYISQTRTYSEYFDDPNNRRWFHDKYGFNVYRPRRWLVVGRRKDFSAEVWRKIVSDYRDVEIINFDDLVDGVTVQFYK